MALMESQNGLKEAEKLKNLTIEDKSSADQPHKTANGSNPSDSELPPTPTPPDARLPSPQQPDKNGHSDNNHPQNKSQYGYQMMRNSRGGQPMAPRNLPPYVSSPNHHTKGPTRGWAGAPLPLTSNNKSSGGEENANHAVVLPSIVTDGRSSPTGSEPSSSNGGEAGVRQPCAFFLKTGSCAYGDRCKFEHPFDKAPVVMFNSGGFPLRPEEPECPYYMKHQYCAYGHTCKFHHPELSTMPPPQSDASTPRQSPSAPPPPPQMIYPTSPMAAQQQYQQYIQYQQMGIIQTPYGPQLSAMGYYQPPKMMGMPVAAPGSNGAMMAPPGHSQAGNRAMYAMPQPGRTVMMPGGGGGYYQGPPPAAMGLPMHHHHLNNNNGGPQPVRRSGGNNNNNGPKAGHAGGQRTNTTTTKSASAACGSVPLVGENEKGSAAGSEGQQSSPKNLQMKPLMVFNSPGKASQGAAEN